ncbi:MAG TPA: GTP 3',8-cyclase MoaA [Symbiobacteriaceae bacterium]|nr:GTP 3',8-cyclase MoaA [Symbiobacteriaceae bacterium]
MLLPLVSPGNRPIHYLRISVTDRCDMRCLYCMPAGGMPFMPSDTYLTDDEIVRIVRIAADMGVHKIRLTGGEPLLRPGIVDLIQAVSSTQGIRDVALSTNASNLERYAERLARAGLKRINVSLDTLDARQFREITRGGSLARTLAGLDAAEKAGLTPIKINTVVIRGLNDKQIPAMLDMGLKRNWQVRFIEYMPIGSSRARWDDQYMPAEEILERLMQAYPLEELPMKDGAPARLYRIAGSEATVGVITPVSRHFCDTCNRLRVTADGIIRSCLLVKGEADLRTLMRAGGTDEDLAKLLAQAAALKPEWHGVGRGCRSEATDAMREIGG